MEKFLDIVYTNWLLGQGSEFRPHGQEIEGFKERLKELVSNSLFKELDETLNDALDINHETAFIQGMTLAIEIMNNEYVPFV